MKWIARNAILNVPEKKPEKKRDKRGAFPSNGSDTIAIGVCVCSEREQVDFFHTFHLFDLIGCAHAIKIIYIAAIF